MKISEASQIGAYWIFTVRAWCLWSWLLERESFLSALPFSQVFGFIVSVWLVGLLFSLGPTALFRDSEYFFQS